MRKQELIHMHGLLAEVANFCKDDSINVDIEEYKQLKIRATSVQRSKGSHEEAVFALTEAITTAVDDGPNEMATAGPASAD